jgi:hypothetical protein
MGKPMINPDMKAIVFSFLIADMAIPLFMILIAVQNYKRFRGIKSWVAAFVLQNLGIIFIELRGIVPDWSSFVLSNTMLVAGFLAGLYGMCRFLNVKYKHVPNYLLILLFVVIQIWFSLFRPDLSARTLNLAVAMVLLSTQYIRLIFFRVTERLRQLAAGVGIIFIGYAVVNMVRIADFFIGGNNNNDYFAAGLFEKVVFITYQVLFIFLAYSLALMYNRKLMSELATRRKNFQRHLTHLLMHS